MSKQKPQRLKLFQSILTLIKRLICYFQATLSLLLKYLKITPKMQIHFVKVLKFTFAFFIIEFLIVNKLIFKQNLKIISK